MENKFYFARRCDVTGYGMDEGFVFGSGERYAKEESDALKIAQEMGYESLDEAFDDGAYEYTAWYFDEEYVSEYKDGRDAKEIG